jgi:hypothetical protein
MAAPHSPLTSFVRRLLDSVDWSTDRFGAANGASAGRRKALAFLEDKTAIKAARWLRDQGSSVAEGSLHVGKVLVHFFLAYTQQA